MSEKKVKEILQDILHNSEVSHLAEIFTEMPKFFYAKIYSFGALHNIYGEKEVFKLAEN